VFAFFLNLKLIKIVCTLALSIKGFGRLAARCLQPTGVSIQTVFYLLLIQVKNIVNL
jgi:hypothetical protein